MNVDATPTFDPKEFLKNDMRLLSSVI